MNRRQIRFLFAMSLLELIVLYGCVMYACFMKGNVPLATGVVGLILMVCSFIGSVYGGFEMKTFKENRNFAGIVGTRLHMLIFLIIVVFYVMGLIL